MYRISEIEEVEANSIYVVRGSVRTGWISGVEPRYEDVSVTVLCDGGDPEIANSGIRRESDEAVIENTEFADAAVVAVWAYLLGCTETA